MSSASIEEATEFVLDGTHGSPVRTETGIPVLSAQNVKNGALDYGTDRYTTAGEYEAFKKRLPLDRGDVLLTIVGTIGRAAVLEDVRPLVFQRSVAVIRPRKDLLSPRFLYHVSQSETFQSQLARASNQSSQAGVYLEKLKKVRIPLPPLPEQRRIAAILDKADELRAKRRAALKKLDELTHSIFLDMFGDPATNPKGWPLVCLRDLATRKSVQVAPSEIDPGTPYIGLEHISPGGAVEEGHTVSSSGLTSNKFMFSSGDLLYGKLRPYLAKVAVPQFAGVCSTDILVYAPVMPDATSYLRAVLLHPSQVKKASSLSTGANLPRIAPQVLDAFKIPLPPDNLLRQFASNIAKLDSVREAQKRALIIADALFASLQHRAFRGEL